jgi:hypothetical protein
MYPDFCIYPDVLTFITKKPDEEGLCCWLSFRHMPALEPILQISPSILDPDSRLNQARQRVEAAFCFWTPRPASRDGRSALTPVPLQIICGTAWGRPNKGLDVVIPISPRLVATPTLQCRGTLRAASQDGHPIGKCKMLALPETTTCLHTLIQHMRHLKIADCELFLYPHPTHSSSNTTDCQMFSHPHPTHAATSHVRGWAPPMERSWAQSDQSQGSGGL